MKLIVNDVRQQFPISDVPGLRLRKRCDVARASALCAAALCAAYSALFACKCYRVPVNLIKFAQRQMVSASCKASDSEYSLQLSTLSHEVANDRVVVCKFPEP